MGPLPTAILIGCLNALMWLLWLSAFLLAVLVISENLRGIADAAPWSGLILAAILALAGVACGFLARKFTPQ